MKARVKFIAGKVDGMFMLLPMVMYSYGDGVVFIWLFWGIGIEW